MNNNINNSDDNDIKNQSGEAEDINSKPITDEGNSTNSDSYNSSNEKLNKKNTEKPKFSWKDFSVRKAWLSLKEFWENLEPKKKRLVIFTAASVIVFAVVLALILNSASPKNKFVTIFSGLEMQEAREIMGVLEAMNIKANFNQYNEIEVREKDANKAVMQLVAQGYPKAGGLIYESSVSQNMFPSTFEIEQSYLNDKERRLEATIQTLAGIEYAVVNFEVPESSNRLWNRTTEPSKATVVLHIKRGYTLSYEAVEGIERLILNSLADLTVENITITDGEGVALSAASYSNSKATSLSDLKIQYEKERIAYLESKVLASLGTVLGRNNVEVIVSCTYDFNSFVQETINYVGANIDDEDVQSGIISREELNRYIHSGIDSSVLGEAGTPLNDDDEGYYEPSVDVEGGDYGDDYSRVRDYLVGQVSERLEKETPDIKSITVAVFVNREELDIEVEDMIIEFVVKATGIQDIAFRDATEDTVFDADYYRNYVSVGAMRFEPVFVSGQEEPFNLIEWLLETYTVNQLLIAAGILLLLIIIIIVIVIIAKKIGKSRKEAAIQKALAAEEAMNSPANVDEFGKTVARYAADESMPEIKTSESREQVLKKQIRIFTDQNPDISAQLIRTLLKGDESNG